MRLLLSWRLAVVVVAGAAWLSVTSSAQIVTDGSLSAGGKPQTLKGPNFQIGADLGRKVGGNLFHSFQSFNIQPGESAMFTAPAGSRIHNVLARVTGPDASVINGQLACDIPGANLLLANPNGVVFGSGASLNVQGAFAVTTADVIHLADGGQFHTRGGHAQLLTAAAPAAFGFLRQPNGPAPIAVTGTMDGSGQLAPDAPNLTVSTGKDLTLVGGELRITSGTVNAPGGRVNLVSVASPGKVDLDPGSATSPVRTTGFRTLGDITIEDGSLVSVDANRAGSIVIRGGSATVQRFAAIESVTTEGDSGSIDIAVRGDLKLANGGSPPPFIILSVTTGAGRGADIHLSSGSTSISDGAVIFSLNDHAAGNAGNITLHTGSLQINSGAILAQANGPGHGGGIKVTARDISLDGGGVSTAPAGLLIENPTDVDPALQTGPLGDLFITARTLSVTNAARISNVTRGQGKGGNVTINVPRISLDSPAPDPTLNPDEFTGIRTQSVFVQDQSDQPVITGHEGPAGSVLIKTRHLDVTGSSSIATNTQTAAPAARITIDAPGGAVRLDGAGGTLVGLDASSTGQVGAGTTGHAGSIVVRAGSLQILNGAIVRANTFDPGAGGNVDVSAHSLLIDSGVGGSDTGIGSEVEQQGTGRGGNVTVRAGHITVANQGRIAVATLGAAPGGDLNITAARIDLRDGGRFSSESVSASPLAQGGNLNVHANSIYLRNGGLITASTRAADQGGTANGGGITVNATQTLLLDNSQITAQAAKNGGNIHVTVPLTITLQNGSEIRTDATNGNGGNIAIDPLILTLNRSTINANGGINGGNVQISADAKPGVSNASVTATGQRGVSGIITNNPASTDIARAITRLPGSLLSIEARLQPQCAEIGNFSSFLVTGKGGLSLNPEFWQLPAGTDRRPDSRLDGK